MEAKETPKHFYQKTWFIVVMLLVFPPVGIYLMWKQDLWSKTARIVISGLLLASMLFGFFVKPDNVSTVLQQKQETKVAAKSEVDKAAQKATLKKDVSSTRKKPVDNMKYIEVDVNTLLRDIKSNAAAANKKYKGKQVIVNGFLTNIDSEADYINIGVADEFELMSLQAFTHGDKNLKEKVIGLTKGQRITVYGKITDVGDILGYSMDLKGFDNPIKSRNKKAMRVVRGEWKADDGSTLIIDWKKYGDESYSVNAIVGDDKETVVTLSVGGEKRLVDIWFKNGDDKHITIGKKRYTKVGDVGTAP